MNDPAARYTATAKLLHWIIALVVLVQLGVAKLADLDEGGLLGWHMTAGLLVLVLMVPRLAWRATHAVPPPPAATPGWQRRAAQGTHHLFYLLLFLLPLSGWALASAEGEAVSFLGLGVPSLPVPAGESAEEAIEETHEILGNLVLVLAAVHVLAGLKHHFIDRDDVLRRMLPR